MATKYITETQVNEVFSKRMAATKKPAVEAHQAGREVEAALYEYREAADAYARVELARTIGVEDPLPDVDAMRARVVAAAEGLPTSEALRAARMLREGK